MKNFSLVQSIVPTTRWFEGTLVRCYTCFTISIMFTALFLAMATLASANTEVSSSHPRVGLTPARLAELKAEYLDPARPSSWDRLISYAANNMGKSTAALVDNFSLLSRKSRVYTFLHATTGERKYLDKVRAIAKEIVRRPLPSTDTQIHALSESLAIIFDWSHSGLTAQDKAEFIRYIESALSWFKDHRLNIKGVVGGHQYGSHEAALIGALAIYWESAAARKTVDIIMTNLRDHYWPFYKYISGEDGGFHMGWEYSRYYHRNTYRIFDAWRSATGENLFAVHDWLEKAAYFYMYGTKGNGTVFRTGDNKFPSIDHLDRYLYRKVAIEYKNGMAKWWANRLKKEIGIWAPMAVLDLIWGNSEINSEPPNMLLTSKLFEHAGVVAMKGGWEWDEDTPRVSAIFKSTPYYFENHSHRDVNSFEINYRGDLAIDSGTYASYGSPHWLNYYTRTIAHNSIVVFDPNETFKLWGKTLVNDGGQRLMAPPKSLADILSGTYTVGGIAIYDDTSEYTYAVGNGTDAYSSDKLEAFDRHFLFLKDVEGADQPVIIILDRIKKVRPDLKATWLLHAVNKPMLYAKKAVITNDDGNLEATFLSPETIDIRTIGGTGSEFKVGATNYVPTRSPKADDGRWRVEAFNNQPRKEEIFLVVLSIGDAGSFSMPKSTLLNIGEQTARVGAVIGKTVVLFNGNDVSPTLEYKVAGEGPFEHFVFEVSPGSAYEIRVGNIDIMNYTVSQSGTLSFRSGSGGAVKIRRATGKVLPTPPTGLGISSKTGAQ